MARLTAPRNRGKLAGTVLDFIATLDDISDRALDLIDAAGVAELPVYWNSRFGTTGGRCFYNVNGALYIDLNPTLRDEGPEALRNTFLHEVAHAVAGRGANHGPAWKRVHRALGGNAHRTHKYEALAANRRPSSQKLVGYCADCAEQLFRVQRLKPGRTYRHTGGCGGKVIPC